jgi:hypothetical protein
LTASYELEEEEEEEEEDIAISLKLSRFKRKLIFVQRYSRKCRYSY